ncbi:MAG: hypothetical protein KIT69_15230 [Propionibacteriaceae bacterium]|nr:hypothetical protein [Propionibacteriaceae bacterium]
MIDLLIRVAVFLAEAAIGLFVAALIVPGFTMMPGGFVTAVIVFAVCQSLVSLATTALSRKYASWLLVGVGLISTLIALFVASLFEGGIAISGASAWVLATLIVWAVSSLASWALRTFLLKEPRRS